MNLKIKSTRADKLAIQGPKLIKREEVGSLSHALSWYASELI